MGAELKPGNVHSADGALEFIDPCKTYEKGEQILYLGIFFGAPGVLATQSARFPSAVNQSIGPGTAPHAAPALGLDAHPTCAGFGLVARVAGRDGLVAASALGLARGLGGAQIQVN